ncbi:MAG TPA: hypothetical protein VNM40_03710 [Candidatus Paceibacterota bacterium]|nr:hypothetical protein [Candidatus Paceibacterota bacterium]
MPKGHEKELSKTSLANSIEHVKDAKDISNVLNILDSHSIRTNPFGANVSGENSYRRAERISAALHLITNHVPTSEPLRTSIRKAGLHLLDLLLELRTGFRSPASEKGRETLSVIRELVSHVRMLAIAGYISVQNGHAITEALDELGSLIVASQKSVLSEQLTISRDDLVPPAHESTPVRSREPSRTRAPKRTRDEQKDTAQGEQGSSGRSDQIMDILKLGGTLGIKDIAANLPQYSEKMIQRELAHLANAGKVQKIGAKRWSKYRIVP